MYKITVSENNKTTHILAAPGTNLLKALTDGGILVDAPCGGRGMCGKCRVYINGVGERAACKERVQSDMSIVINRGTHSVLTDGIQRKTENSDTGFGIAVDIGTTTIAVALTDMKSGKIIDTRADINPQKSFGADVVSRIGYCINNVNGVNILQQSIISKLDALICDITRANNTESIKKATVVGNTAMLHILLGKNPKSLAYPPFTPVFTDAQKIRSHDIGFTQDFPLITLPSSSAYIGADIISALIACEADKLDKPFLLIDIGTNGEMVIGSSKDGFYSCSVAAGPAFEGAHIECGLGSVPGAVDSVRLNNGMAEISTIKQQPSAGICGSGLVDTIAEFLRNGIINSTGEFVKQSLWSRYMSDNTFTLSKRVRITQSDIREVQLAKAAFSAGEDILMRQSGVSAEDINRVFIAGGMGTHINKLNAAQIGLLPSDLTEKTVSCGNAALSGAVSVLCDTSLLDTAHELSLKIQNIELADYEDFEQMYIQRMNF